MLGRSHLESGEPHEPIEAVVVGRNEAGWSGEVARFALELVFQPLRLRGLRVTAAGSLEAHLRALLRNTAEGKLVVR